MRRHLVLLSLAIGSGCSKQSPPAPEPSPAVSTAPAPATATGSASASAAKAAPPKKVIDDRTIHAFAGTIGSDQKIRMYLERKGSELSGLYVPEGGTVDVPVKGNVKADDKFVLEERDDKGKVVGTFDGWFKSGLLKGTYTDSKSKKPRVFVTEPLKFANAPFTTSYSGALGGTLRIRAKLTRKGDALEGVYRYAKSKENLVLTGKVDAEGDVVLDETTKAGQKTGRIEGVLLSPALFVGRWYSPDKTKSLSMLIEQSDSYPELVDLGSGVSIAPQEDYKELAKNCTSALLYPIVEGAKGKAALNAAIRKELGARIDKSSCEGASAEIPYAEEKTYSVQRAKLPWFGLGFSTYESLGGAHPSWWSTCRVANADTGELASIARKMTPEARKKLSRIVTDRLKKEHNTESLTEAGFFEEELAVTEQTNICIGENGALSVEYNPYDVAPWVMGAPTVALTKAESKELLPTELAALIE